MIVRPDDAIHKSYLNRILIEICDNPDLPSELVFKGGTAAAMLGYLDRFSVDLDFDLVEGLPADKIKLNLNDIFASLDLDVVKEFDRAIMYEVKYQGEGGGRSRLKVSVN